MLSCVVPMSLFYILFFFFNDPAPPETYTLSLHDALPISSCADSDATVTVPVFGSTDTWTPFCSRTSSPSLRDRKSTRLNSSHVSISYAVFCLKKKNKILYSHIHTLTVTSPSPTQSSRLVL